MSELASKRLATFTAKHYSLGGAGVLGFSQLVNVHSYSVASLSSYEAGIDGNLDSAFLNVGETYVIDLDEVGLAVTVDGFVEGGDGRGIDVTLEYRQRGR